MVLRLVAGVFAVLHGLVHLFYFAQSRRLFELEADMVWPDGSWAFSRLLRKETTRWLAAICCILAAIGFAVGGAAILLGQGWWQPVVVGAAAFSTAIWVIFWDSKMQKLANQGGIAILINLAILILILVFRWPDFRFQDLALLEEQCLPNQSRATTLTRTHKIELPACRPRAIPYRSRAISG